MRPTLLATLWLLSCAHPLPRPVTSSEWQERYRDCRAGNQYACRWRGMADLQEGRWVQGVKTLETACSANVGEACNELGFIVAYGWYQVPVNAERGRALWARACELGSKDGCDAWGTGLRDGVGGQVDLPGAVAAYERACKQKDASGCSNLGAALLVGQGTRQDVARAVTLWRATCAEESEIKHSCRLLGSSLVLGDGVEADVSAGFTLLRRACNLGDAEDCQVAGDLMSSFGSKAEGIRYLRASCSWGRAAGCRSLGMRLLEGPPDDGAHEEALEVLRAACARKDQPSCDRLAKLGRN